jgi:hypothetical protein
MHATNSCFFVIQIVGVKGQRVGVYGLAVNLLLIYRLLGQLGLGLAIGLEQSLAVNHVHLIVVLAKGLQELFSHLDLSYKEIYIYNDLDRKKKQFERQKSLYSFQRCVFEVLQLSLEAKVRVGVFASAAHRIERVVPRHLGYGHDVGDY